MLITWLHLIAYILPKSAKYLHEISQNGKNRDKFNMWAGKFFCILFRYGILYPSIVIPARGIKINEVI